MSDPDPDQQTRPTAVGADGAPDRNRTPVADLSGHERTLVSDLSGDPTLVARPGSPRTAMTLPAGGDVQDALPTQLAGGGVSPGTDVTDLHVKGGQPSESSGTHLGETWGDFQFIRLLGRGGMGAVYLGRQLSLDREVAIKVLPSHLSENEQFRERFQLEAKAVAKMSSPHVVQVFAAGIHQGHHYFAMEYVDGEDLSRRLRSGLKPSYRQALDLVIQAAKGLAAAGEHGIVHRDIKPGNMMIDRKGSLKIMDFGLVRLASAAHSLTMSGTVMGTVSYFSPEQGRGEPCDQRTDLYAVGVVFYELLTGRLPFTGENATSIIYQHIHSSPRSPRELDPNIPEDFQAVVLKCMQKRADDRYASAAELVSDLERLAAGQPPAIALERPDLLRTGATIVGSGGMGPPGRAAPARRRVGGLVAGLVVLVAAAGGAWWFLRQQPAPELSPPPVAPSQPPVSAADPQVAAMLAALAQNQELDRERREAIALAEAMLAEGRHAEAETHLAELVASDPADRQLAAALRRVQAAREQAERLAAAAAREAEPVTSTVDVALAGARAALARGDLPEARRVVNVNRGLRADDPAWADVARALDVAEGQQALTEADAAFQRGNIEAAGVAAARAKGLIPDDPGLERLLAAIERVEGQRAQRERVLQEADNLLTENQPARAEDLLVALSAQFPDDAQVVNALRRARAARERTEALDRAVREQLEQGVAALARADLDAALLAFTAARQLDPKNASAAEGLDAVRARREALDAGRRRIEAAIQAGDLATAEAELTALERLAPGSPQTVLATSQVSAARLAKAEERRQADQLERQRQDAAKALLARLDDPGEPVQALTAAVEAFATEAGAGRAELPELRRRLDDRASRVQAQALVDRFATAFAAGDLDALRADCLDPAVAEPFAAFRAMAGARLGLALGAFTRSAEVAVASVALTHAADLSPETRQDARWELRRVEGVWRIASITLDPPAQGSR